MTLRSRQRPVDRIDLSRTGPKVLAYGIGVDSTALLIELVARGEPPDLVLTADTGSEKPETYEYQAMMAAKAAAAARRALEDVDDATRTRDGGRDASATPRATACRGAAWRPWDGPSRRAWRLH